jgi:antitoxin MazE
MKSMIVRWGNSQGVRLTKDILADACLAVGDAVTIEADRDGVLIRKATRHRTLAERMSGYAGTFRPGEWDTGPDRGKEALR